MNSLKALESIVACISAMSFVPIKKIEEIYSKQLTTIKKDLERLEKLEEENEKLKQALDIIKIKKIDVFELKFSYSVIEYNIMARNSDFDELTQEEYELLKEVLENG